MATAKMSRGLRAVMIGWVLALCAGVAATAWAHPGPHGGPGRGPEGPLPGLLMGPPERIDRAVDRLLDRVKATDPQRTQVKQIAQAAAKDLRGQMDAGRGLREQGMALFTAPTIDEAAIEAHRVQMTRQHDAVSQRVSRAMVDIAKVLTPEQRRMLAERFEKRREGRQPPTSREPGAPPPPASKS